MIEPWPESEHNEEKYYCSSFIHVQLMKQLIKLSSIMLCNLHKCWPLIAVRIIYVKNPFFNDWWNVHNSAVKCRGHLMDCPHVIDAGWEEVSHQSLNQRVFLYVWASEMFCFKTSPPRSFHWSLNYNQFPTFRLMSAFQNDGWRVSK